MSKYKPPGGLYLEGRFNGGFFVLRVWGGLYLEGLIFGIFTVSSFSLEHKNCRPQTVLTRGCGRALSGLIYGTYIVSHPQLN